MTFRRGVSGYESRKKTNLGGKGAKTAEWLESRFTHEVYHFSKSYL
ncbi:MAG: hypothetical protein PHI19_05440 [Clostridia bacterium]|nr:hypothetical protein [Clostridia bacterium]